MNNDKARFSHGFIARTTEVQLRASLDSLDSIVRLHYNGLVLGFPQAFPVDVEEYVAYCKSVVTYKLRLATNSKLSTNAGESQIVRNALRSATLPSFLEAMVERLGVYYDQDTGVNITWERPDYKPLGGRELADISLRISAVRQLNVDLAFNAVSMKDITEFDNAYIVDHDSVWSLSGADVKGYQTAAVLDVTVVQDVHKLLFRKNLCSRMFARQEVVNGFGH